MPFITIELSENLEFALQPFVAEMHTFLAPLLKVPVEIFKTKLLKLAYTVVGDGEKNIGYARLKIELKKGRDRKMLTDCLQELLKRFSTALQEQNPNRHFRVSAEFSEIDPDFLVAVGV